MTSVSGEHDSNESFEEHSESLSPSLLPVVNDNLVAMVPKRDWNQLITLRTMPLERFLLCSLLLRRALLTGGVVI